MEETTIPLTDETETRVCAITMAVACCQMSNQEFPTALAAKDQVLSFADELAHWIDNGTDSIRITCDPRLAKAAQT